MDTSINLFVSYRSLDAQKVDEIATRLRSVKTETGQFRYEVWQDKKAIKDGQDWWTSIVKAIGVSQVFVYMISRESLRSEICKAEFQYAHKRNRPIIPIVLEGEFFHNAQKDRYDIDYWEDMPIELVESRANLLFYVSGNFIQRFESAVEAIFKNPKRWRDVDYPEPQDPRELLSDSGNNIAKYDEACECAQRMDFAGAEKLFRKLLNDSMFGDEAHAWLQVLIDYRQMLDLDARENTRHKVPEHWKKYLKGFPKKVLPKLYDPKNFDERFTKDVKPTKAKEHPPVKIIPEKPQTDFGKGFSINAITKFLPKSLAWSFIPKGEVILKGIKDKDGRNSYIANGASKVIALPDFYMGKYPVTNEDFKPFVDAKAYQDRSVWTAEGWKQCQSGIAWNKQLRDFAATDTPWEEPRFWQDAEWNQPDYPVVGVSWYEAVAYCQWLNCLLPADSGLKIILPSEAHWQRSAQALQNGGNSKQAYPWGNDWDAARCNNNVNYNGSLKTTSVHAYEGLGDSPCGVIDLVGNGWEWTSTGYYSGSDDYESGDTHRVMRGSSYNNHNTKWFHNEWRYQNNPIERYNFLGFRIALVQQ